MPILEKELSYYQMREKERTHWCAECGSHLNVAWSASENCHILRCAKDIEHNNITKQRKLTAREEAFANERRRKALEQKIGTDKTHALARYEGNLSLTKAEGMDILKLVFPTCQDTKQIERAALVCVSYHLNPLMGHVFLIPFKTQGGGQTWATVMGIKAKRLLASRRGTFSYIDDTPRIMTEKEQETRFGEVMKDRIVAIVKLKDMKSGAEVVGYGTWMKADRVYGTEKGNSAFNMASIRAESQALDRLRPGEMPSGIEAVEESAIEGDYHEVKVEVEQPQDQPERQETEQQPGQEDMPLTTEPKIEQPPEQKHTKPAAQGNEKIPATLGDLLQWCVSHSSKCGREWFFKTFTDYTPESMKVQATVIKAYQEVKSLMGW